MPQTAITSRPFESTPLVIDGMLYLSTPSNRVVALDAESGQEIWQFDPQAGVSGQREFFQHRGVAYWQSKTGDDRRILLGTFEGRLIALDAKTGKHAAILARTAWSTCAQPPRTLIPHAEYSVTSPRLLSGSGHYRSRSSGVSLQGPQRHGSCAFIYSFRQLVWTFTPFPNQGSWDMKVGIKNAWKDRTGANVWSLMSVDSERGLIFNAYWLRFLRFLRRRPQGLDLFSNCLVALEAVSGKLVWYYQMVHHDIWDYDMPAQPVLITVRRNGREIPAVAQVTKMGFVFIFDRRTGNRCSRSKSVQCPPAMSR